MKKRIKTILCICCLILVAFLLIGGCFYYTVNRKKNLRDASVSLNGDYELLLIEIGEPAWPFGAASGQLVLKKGDTPICKANFELKNDGCGIGKNCWRVAWNEDHTKTIQMVR